MGILSFIDQSIHMHVISSNLANKIRKWRDTNHDPQFVGIAKRAYLFFFVSFTGIEHADGGKKSQPYSCCF